MGVFYQFHFFDGQFDGYFGECGEHPLAQDKVLCPLCMDEAKPENCSVTVCGHAYCILEARLVMVFQ